jgi:hypothetical protein
MYQPISQVRLRGFLTEPARLFVSRSGQPRIAVRMEVWIDPVATSSFSFRVAASHMIRAGRGAHGSKCKTRARAIA